MTPTDLRRLADQIIIADEALTLIQLLRAHVVLEAEYGETQRLLLRGIEGPKAVKLFEAIMSMAPGNVMVPFR